MSKIIITVECDDEADARSVLDKLTNRAAAPEVAPEKTAAPVEQTKSDDVDDVVTDSDGMPWDEAVHASSREVNTDGTWKARRGKATEAKAARAAFKASGGDVTAPVVEEAPGLPGTKTSALPGADAIPPAEPITFDAFVEKATAVLASKKIDNAGISALYCEVTGEADVGAAAAKLETNETMRRAAVDKLTEIENA